YTYRNTGRNPLPSSLDHGKKHRVRTHPTPQGDFTGSMGAVWKRSVCAEGEAMSTLIRTGISLESDLLVRFDRAIHKKGYKNRSEAIRDLVRDYAVAEDVEENRTVVGTLTMVYDHHRPKLSENLIEAQHHAEDK